MLLYAFIKKNVLLGLNYPFRSCSSGDGSIHPLTPNRHIFQESIGLFSVLINLILLFSRMFQKIIQFNFYKQMKHKELARMRMRHRGGLNNVNWLVTGFYLKCVFRTISDDFF